MTKEEIFETFKNVGLKFHHYLYGSFTFVGYCADVTIYATVDGETTDVGKVSADERRILADLNPIYIVVARDGKKVHSWNGIKTN